MGSENRRHPRWDLNLEIKYKANTKGFSFGKILGGQTKGVTVNISLSGALVKSTEKLEPGTKIDVKIHFPSSESLVTGQAETLYARKDGDHYQIGLRFIDIHTETDDLLGEVLQQQLDQIKNLPTDKFQDARRRIIERLFASLIQTELTKKKA